MQILKKISNWTFGGLFRTLGRFLAYIVVGILLLFLASKTGLKLPKLLGIETVNAATVNTSSVQYRLYWYNYGYSNTAGNSAYTNAGTGIDLDTDYPTVKLVYSFNTIFNFGNNTLVAGRKYKVVMTYTLSPTSNMWQNNYKRDTQFLFSGSTNGSTWNDGYIEESSATIKPNCETCDRNTATFYITPNTNINYLRIIMRIPPNNRELDTFDRNKAYAWNRANLPAGDYIKVTYTNDETAQSVQELTQIIQDINGQIEDSLTSEDSNPESKKCGVICKLKHIVNFLKVDNLINIIIPTSEQMNDLFTQFQTGITNKLGILGLPVTLYTQIMHLIDNTTENNWCFNWEGIEVPNFEDYTIIPAGQYCFNDMLANNKIKALRDFSITFTGALIILAFLQFLKNMLHRILDVPDRDNYEYFTQEDVYTIDKDTGEVTGHQIKNRSTYKEVRK